MPVLNDKAISQCEGKERFESMEIAHQVARRRRRGSKRDVPGGAYRCRFCKGYHIGRIFNKAYRTGRVRPRVEEVEA